MRSFGLPRLFDTVGTRVMALIMGTTIPLALIAGLLAWHSYLATISESAGRVAMAANLVRGELVSDLARTRMALRIFLTSGVACQDVPRAADMLETLSPGSYCIFALIGEDGRIVRSFGHNGDGTLRCGRLVVAWEDAVSWLKPDPSNARQDVTLLPEKMTPLVRVTSPVSYLDTENRRRNGTIVAVEALSIDALRAMTTDMRTSPSHNSVEIWIASSTVDPVLLARPFSSGETGWSRPALDQAHALFAAGGRSSGFLDAGTYYSVAPLIGDMMIVARSSRNEAEQRALNLFLARVLLIAALLGLEFVAVAYAAHAYVVAPLEKLATAVTDWRRRNVFEVAESRALPLEIRDLERAFRRAIGRLARHEERLRRAGRQQEALIREIHHRVKNNLQIVASLLNLQANRATDTEVREEFQLVRDRVRALATLHRYLYPEGGIAALDIAAFLEELCGQIYLSQGVATNGRVRLRLEVEPVPLSPDQAVPLSLIVNETVNNALRHAFPAGRTGEILVSLKQTGDGRCVLRVRDDGVGLSQASETALRENRKGLGIQLVRGFARQMHGEFHIDTDGGTCFEVNFVLTEPPVRSAASLLSDPPALRGLAQGLARGVGEK